MMVGDPSGNRAWVNMPAAHGGGETIRLDDMEAEKSRYPTVILDACRKKTTQAGWRKARNEK